MLAGVLALLSGIDIKRIGALFGLGVVGVVATYFLYDNARHRIDNFLGGGTAYDQVDLAHRTQLAGQADLAEAGDARAQCNLGILYEERGLSLGVVCPQPREMPLDLRIGQPRQLRGREVGEQLPDGLALAPRPRCSRCRPRAG